MSPPLILASTSRWRAGLLKRLGLAFVQADSDLDEVPWKSLGLAPADLVTQLAVAKARAVAGAYPDALVLGGDQVAVLDGNILGKPGTVEAACAQLDALAGRTHELVTGTALLDCRSGTLHTTVDVHRMRMRSLSGAQIASYIAREQPLDACGSYYVEGLGIALFDELRGSDFTAIMGLPLTHVVDLLGRAGVDVLA
jgi:septum formation protein